MNCCARRRKSPFRFENGTTVYASSYELAVSKLKNTDERHFSIEKIEEYKWLIEFSNGVFVEFESPSEFRARMQGPWLMIQDKRSFKLL